MIESNSESLGTNFIQSMDDISICTCGVIETTLCIGNDGRIFPCSLLIKDKYAMGNIKDIHNLKDWLVYKYYASTVGYNNLVKLFPENINKCRSCTVKDFCWGCLEVTDRLIQSDAKFIKRCKSLKGPLEDFVWNQKEENQC